MGSIHNKSRLFGGAPPHHNSPCTRAHQIGALAVVLTTFFFTRLFDQSSLSSSCPNSFNVHQSYNSRDDVVRFPNGDGSIVWPHRGYGSHLSLKIYVYDEHEIDGLKELMYGRDGKILPDSCLKGQWGTQVPILIISTLFMFICVVITCFLQLKFTKCNITEFILFNSRG